VPLKAVGRGLFPSESLRGRTGCAPRVPEYREKASWGRLEKFCGSPAPRIAGRIGKLDRQRDAGNIQDLTGQPDYRCDGVDYCFGLSQIVKRIVQHPNTFLNVRSFGGQLRCNRLEARVVNSLDGERCRKSGLRRTYLIFRR
jgi:hypothetical protein